MPVHTLMDVGPRMVLIYRSQGRAFRYCEVMESVVRETRIRLCLSVEDLAEMLGVSATSVADLERDEAAGAASPGSILQALQTMVQKGAAFVMDENRLTTAEQVARRVSEGVKTTMALEGQGVAEELYERALSNELARLISDSPEITRTITRDLEVKARWWRRLENEFGTLSAYATGLLLGIEVDGPDSVSAQKSAGKLLSYRSGRDRFPLFQFDLDQATVLPVIPELIALARSFGYTDSDLVLWMITESSLFAQQDRPVDHLSNPEELLMAANYHFDKSF